MQADPSDSVPVPASSPPLSPFRTQTALARDDVRLRRTAVAPTAGPATPAATPSSSIATSPPAGSMIKIHLWMPHADLVPGSAAAARSGWTVAASTTVRDAKAAIASGSAGYGRWEPHGLRLIWRGRLLQDDEVLESVFTGVDEPTVHVVARPLAESVMAPVEPPLPSATANPSQFAALAPKAASSAQTVALADTIHYLIFVCREHMCAIIGRRGLKWEDTYPAPTVSRAEAYEAILTVVRAYAGDEWASSLAGDGDRKALEGAWRALGVDAMVAEINSHWRSLVGRDYGANGDAAQIELDLETFTLHLPALKNMVPSQLTHLLFYLRTASLVRFLSACLAEQEAAPSAAAAEPTPTAAAPEAANAQRPRVLYQGSIRIRVPRLRVSFALIQHLFWSAMRILTIMWMLTRGMAWSDTRLWLLVALGAGWWAVDGFNNWLAEDRVRRAARLRRVMQADAEARAAGAAQGVPDAAGGAVAGEPAPLDAAAQAAMDAPLHAAAAARAGAAGIRVRNAANANARRQNSNTEMLLRIPYFHLDVDARQLRIRSSRLNPETRRVNSTTPAGTNTATPALRPPALSRPARIVTQLLLPVALWFLTLIPAFEAQRAREIRNRERTMRSVIASMNPEQNDDNDNENDNTNENEPAAPRQLNLPAGLSEQAKAYYTRVASSSEAIDWEEEREAQRAMGIPDEDEGAAAGAGFLAALL